tara:strand:- start:361 stop:474 length:114 start_codon:yes stop_codon:yes gene_type:complete
MQILLALFLLVRDTLFFVLNFATELVSAVSLFISSLL